MKPIFVTRPNLPDLAELLPYLEQIWESRILTNNGPFHREFEERLKNYLQVPFVSLIANGTLALIVALQALRITGEVITTPFSFVATAHALRWNGITPIFCDIDADTFTIDPAKIEALITPRTTAILPVHVYGYPCHTEAIQDIADKYGLKVIYDAAHAFGVRRNGISVVSEGDASILSFHGTKLFTTFEGGAIVCKDEKLKKRIDYLRNFGFADEVTVVAPGINAKMNEFQSVVGILGLKIVHEEIANRKRVAEMYSSLLKDVPGISLPKQIPGVEHNHSYFPILIDEKSFGASREEVYHLLKQHHIFARRYFYPLISNLPPYRDLPSARKENLPIANRVAEQVLCLPMYGSLTKEEIERICTIIVSLKKP
ncbi:DegT/DnrJ/EryC1/StrS family aminotransferase [Candidatus Caldatribacterium sp.]|uniref:DegT/DnrJ/EryC1/StrS family aminotransferase n=1 Tax=Candidatus Caldatribacterium sp. TaxID=2282143 RepID=UPI00299214B9|nr:DegT/DnrJ/EryC1/StrS family aminotransferase [Candidatus Caldatribacterium sp.]MDW8082033.1 DegT/DnrJ/EryC1/StrS family aminotransferase [Candidatus Calescibacterium sp.]